MNTTQKPLTQIELDCAAAQKRIQSHINRCAGQHQRAVRLSFSKPSQAVKVAA